MTDYSAIYAAQLQATPTKETKEGDVDEASFGSFVPPRLSEAALYGLPREFLEIVGPHTEADPAALLVQFLVAFGSCAGRNTWFSVEADKHYLNLFALLVGVTSKGRKGTSWGHIKSLFARTGDVWATGCVRSGLSSGEGLIWEVRDPIEKEEPIREKKRIVGYQTVIVDRGVSDKRLLVLEPEFASTLKVMTREGNTLSAVVRQAWDDGMLRALTKNSPAKSTDAHIAIIGHVTRDELRRELTQTDAANGFANRFLFVSSRRSKVLPEGGRLDQEDLNVVVHRLADASQGRAEAQVVRLACLYALLDGQKVIGEPHLRAALALWEYCAASARSVFGDSIGDEIADALLGALRRAGAEGLTRTELSAALSRNCSAAQISRALTLLHENGSATFGHVPTDGRPREVWRLVTVTKETKVA